MASVKCSAEFDIAAIAETAGQKDQYKRKYIDGVLFVEGVTQSDLESAVGDYDHDAALIENAVKSAINAIDQAADSKRAEYITDILGQPVVYRQKYEEVLDYRSSGTAGQYMQAEATRRGITVDALATEIENTRAQWLSIDAQIEAERVGGKQDVRDATDVASVEAARDAAVSAIEVL